MGFVVSKINRQKPLHFPTILGVVDGLSGDHQASVFTCGKVVSGTRQGQRGQPYIQLLSYIDGCVTLNSLLFDLKSL